MSYEQLLYSIRGQDSDPLWARWRIAHHLAVRCPNERFEYGMRTLLIGWLKYADSHKHQYGSGIGDDGVLGPCWQDIGVGLLGLLNGHLGKLDGGTLDALIRTVLTAEGMNPEQEAGSKRDD